MQVYTQEDELIERWQWNDPALRNLSDIVLELVRDQRGRVLDLGCGSGRLAADLAHAGFSVDGIDIEARAVEIGKRIIARNGLDVHLYVGDVMDPQHPVAVGGYDIITCTEVLEHVEQWRELLARASELLRRGGLLVVSVPRDPKQFSVLDTYAGHVRRFHDQELMKVLREDYDDLVVKRLGWPMMRCVVWMYTHVFTANQQSHAMQSQAIWRSPRLSHRLAIHLVYYLLKFDNLFSWLPFGTTLVVRGRKQ